MKLADLEYSLPKELIADVPSKPRDHAKLLVLDKNTGNVLHKHFYDLADILNSNDVLVFNETKVFPARLIAKLIPRFKEVEVLLLNEVGPSIWTAMHKGKVKVNDLLDFSKITAKVIKKVDYEITIEFLAKREEILSFIEENGHTPLPPYIHSNFSEIKLRHEYQTVFAKNNGSVAAPTAGLHFTKDLIEKLIKKGVQVEYLTLHVGAGTFLPIKETDITKHKMHSEYFTLDKKTTSRLNRAKRQGKRIISVGTTTTRVLETCIDKEGRKITPKTGSTNIFIYPPYRFKFVDALITNFHLPHSTLLALVSAFVSKPNTKNEFESFIESSTGKAYMEAIKKNYRFYSFGDGMIIH